MKSTLKLINFSIFLFVFSAGVFADAKKSKHPDRKPSSVERPPQFVLLAFDGSKDISFWDESMAFADTVKTYNETTAGKDLLRYTYFINPTYYLDSSNKSNYRTPGLDRPVSCIGWSDSLANIPRRIQRTNQAFNRGHEIGSHANSHCDASGRDKNNPLAGHPWNEDLWTSEFEQFNKLLFGAYSINKLGAPTEYPPNGFAFKQSDIVGFRAPLLATTDGLWPTLQKFRFRYDTSKTASPTYWPQKQVWGGWNFPLASIKIAGTNRTTLSMDYNWLFYHTAGASKPNINDAERLTFKNQMLDSYKYYFKLNYYGARGPINIGHHFSKWNGGAYWQAMREFAQFVCAKKEVRCVTYTEYANWLDRVDENTMKNYRAGNFEKLPDEGLIKDIAAPLMADVRIDSDATGFDAVIEAADMKIAKLIGAKVQLQINFEPQESVAITREELITKLGKGSSFTIRAALLNKKGVMINWSTYKVTDLGLPTESISDQIENHTNDPETSEAHELE